MKKKNSLVIALFSTTFLTLPAFAYQFEVEAEYSDSETDYDSGFDPDMDEDSISISGTYYFHDVETNKGPLSVAAFLDRASSISAFYSDGETDIDGTEISFSGPAPMGGLFSYGYGSTIDFTFVSPDYEIDTEEYFVSAQYIHAETGWILEASYGYVEQDGDFSIDSEQDIYGIGFGKYIASNTRLMLGYAYTETEVELGTIDETSHSELVNVDLFHVQELGNDTYYDLSLDAGYINPEYGDDSQAYSLGATYYFTSHIGVGVDVSHVDGDDIDTTSYGISSEWFVTDEFSVSLSYTRTEIDNDYEIEFVSDTLSPYRGVDFSSFTSSTVFEESSPDADTDAFTIGAKLRF